MRRLVAGYSSTDLNRINQDEENRKRLVAGGSSSVLAELKRIWSFPSAGRLNQEPPIQEIQKNVAADNRPIPIVYGHAQVGGQVFALDYSGGKLTVGYLICQGEIEGYLHVYADGDPLPAEVSINYYTGASGQVADPLLAAAISGYSDTLDGLAYIVIQYGSGVFDTWPRIVAEIEGKKVYDPRTTTTIYSKNPALHLGDLLSNSDYGGGYTVDATALEAAADACDDTTGISEARRESFAVLSSPRQPEDHADVLRTYAGCFIVYRGQTAYLVPDRPASSSATFTAADIVDGSMVIRKKDTSQLPTVMQVYYTDTTGNEWRERVSDEASVSGVDRRVSQIRLAGITRHSQAYREAVERLNKLKLSDLEAEFVVFDDGLSVEAGDVITVSHPYGLTSKTMRVTAPPEQVSPGRWKILSEEYDAAAYSDEVITQPTTPDTTLPVNAPPDAPTGLTIGETTYQLQNGKYASRLDLSWTAPDSAFITGYSIKVLQGATVVWATTVDSTTVATSPLRELVEYTVEVRALTSLFTGDAVTGNYTIIGKTAIPDAPASLSGFEVAGQVRLSWPASTDIDAERYELRYGTTSGDWDSATVLDIVDGLRLVTNEVPEGTWKFYVRTIDSIQQRSTGEATTTLEVTLDNDAFTAASQIPLEGDFVAMTNMHESVEGRLAEYSTYYADGGDSWSSLFGAAAMSTFTNALASYQTPPGEAIYLSPEVDVVSDKSGNFSAAIDLDDFGSTVTEEIGAKPDGGSYSYVTPLSVQETARYSRVRARSTGPFMVRGSGGQHRIDIVAKEEVGSGTSLASGATTITLSKQYAAARSVVITPEGSAARSAVYDNIQLDNGGVTTFDVYIFDSSGTQVANNFRYQWKGV